MPRICATAYPDLFPSPAAPRYKSDTSTSKGAAVMKFGLMFINSGPFSNPELLAHLAQSAEQCGFESLWTVEHVVIPKDYQSPYPYSKSGKIPGGEDVPIPDPLLPLSFVAALTKKI